MNKRLESRSGSCARLRFLRTFPLRVKGLIPLFKAGPVGADTSEFDGGGGGGGGGGGSMLTGLRSPFWACVGGRLSWRREISPREMGGGDRLNSVYLVRSLRAGSS